MKRTPARRLSCKQSSLVWSGAAAGSPTAATGSPTAATAANIGIGIGNISRTGATSPVVVVLLAGILLALIVLTVVIATSTPGGGTAVGPGSGNAPPGAAPRPAVADGQTATRSEQKNEPPKPSTPVADPNRIKETLQKGKTYEVVLKAGFDTRVEDKDWGLRKVVNIAYAAELKLQRTIEENDGHRIQELRHFVTSRNVKLLSEVESLSIELGPRGMLLLGALETLRPGTAPTVLTARPIIEGVLHPLVQNAVNADAVKAVAHVDSLSGKKIRIVYVDGLGVESVTPVGCSLDASERDFVFTTAALSDCYLFPEVNTKPGEKWTVEGAQFAGLFDPTWRGIPEGDIVIARAPDEGTDDHKTATLKVESGVVIMNASDNSKRRMGRFAPTGQMNYNLNQGFIESARLTGQFSREEVSKDHILFESVFRETPVMKVVYTCQMLP